MRKRLYWLPVGVIACSSLVFAGWLSRFAPPLAAVALAGLSYFVTMRRFIAQMRDQPRPRWVTRWLDLPLFAHFGAGMFALLLAPLSAIAALVGAGSWRVLEAGVYAAGLATSIYAIWIERHFVRIRRLDVAIAGLPPEFDGYRIAQLSDLHVGSFDPKARALEWARLANELEPDLSVVTGDLVTSGSGFYGDVAEAIGALRARDGVLVSMGNHDQSNNDELARRVEACGSTVLRNAAHSIRRGEAQLSVVGLDGKIQESDVTRVVTDCAQGKSSVVLSHYPWAFGACARAGAGLVLTGHTHGGQLGVPFLSQRWNLARITGQLSRGLYFSGKTAMYVNAGLGTTGPPMRLAVPPEIALVTLRCA